MRRNCAELASWQCCSVKRWSGDGFLRSACSSMSSTSSVASSPLVWQCTCTPAASARSKISLQLLRRDVPQSVWRAIVIAGRAQARRKALDRAVDDDLDRAEAQPIGGEPPSSTKRSTSSAGVISRATRSETMRAGKVFLARSRAASCRLPPSGSRLARSAAVVTPFAHAQPGKCAQPRLVRRRAVRDRARHAARAASSRPAPSSRRSAARHCRAARRDGSRPCAACPRVPAPCC